MSGLQVARRRMRNSGLTGASFERPDEAVRWHGAMQAQDYGPAKWSIGQRVPGLVDEDLDRALAAGSIVRTHVLRPTRHFVASDDRWGADPELINERTQILPTAAAWSDEIGEFLQEGRWTAG